MTNLRCYYCKIQKNKDAPAMITCHDQRGCVDVCFEHATWRMTTSWAFGHSSDCPYSDQKRKP
jgi:hypothetical protein